MRRRRKPYLAALTCCLGLLLLPEAAGATFPGSNGKIAYSGGIPGGSSEILTVKPDGSGATNLTNSPNQDVGPSWSPDGKHIAFTSDRATPYHGTDVYVMDADGANVTRLTNASAHSPAWSPDGNKIAFVSGNQISVANADGSGTPVDVTSGYDPSWSPDGTKFAFVRSSDIWTANADGTNATQLTTSSAFDNYPDWSPDGTKLTYSSDAGGLYQIYTMNPDGSGTAAITAPSLQALAPKWSPDGARIIYSSQNDGSLRTVKPDGTGDAVLADAGSYDTDWQSVQVGKVPPAASFSVGVVSPQTGQQVSFTSNSSGGSGSIAQQRWDLDNDGDFDDATGSTASTSFNDPGPHIVRLSVVNSLGFADALARTVVVVAPPDTVISSAPSGTIPVNDPSFAFSSPQSGSAFECRLDLGAWAACTSPFQTSGLGDGPHSFAVRANDGAGHTDPSPAEAAFVVDTPPDTQITSGPESRSATSDARFTFAADQPATFESRRDGGAWVPCASPWSYSSLEQGSHSFEVRATDSTGNTDATPALSFWDVEGCAVPSLKGKKFSTAKRLIKEAGCSLGKVRKPKGVAASKLVVAKQKVRGDVVDLRLVRR